MGKEQKFCGRGWEGKYDIKISVKPEDFPPVNKYGDVRLVVKRRRNPDEKSGATHFVVVDDWYYSQKAKEEDPF